MSALVLIESLDAVAVPLPSGLAAFARDSWNRGAARRVGPARKTSGHLLAVSDADIDASGAQIADALAFFGLHADALHRYIDTLADPTGELIVAACLSPAAVAREVSLPAELAVAAGALGLSISVRTYLADEDA